MHALPRKLAALISAVLITAMVGTGSLSPVLLQTAHAQSGNVVGGAVGGAVGGTVGCLLGGLLGGGAVPAAGAGGVAAAAAGLAVPVVDLPNLGQNTITAGATSAQASKECTLDGILNALAKAAIHAMATSIINWINSGFEGNPVFVTDLREFLGLVDIQEFEAFLGSETVAFLCSPWKLNIQIAIETAFVQRDLPVCSIGDVVDNIEGFVEGNFSEGGWPGWFELTVRNNPYKDYLLTADLLNTQIAAARFRNIKLLEFGRGFLSIERCTERGARPSDIAGVPGSSVQDCEITTPGAVIESQLENVLGTNLRQLELADEINEIITALIAQLINTALTQGLGALSDSFSDPSLNRPAFSNEDIFNELPSGFFASGSAGGEEAISAAVSLETPRIVSVVSTVPSNLQVSGSYQSGVATLRSTAGGGNNIEVFLHTSSFFVGRTGGTQTSAWRHLSTGSGTVFEIPTAPINQQISSLNQVRVVHTHPSRAMGGAAPPSVQDLAMTVAIADRLQRQATGVTYEVVDARGVWRYSVNERLGNQLRFFAGAFLQDPRLAVDLVLQNPQLATVRNLLAAQAAIINASSDSERQAAIERYLNQLQNAGATVRRADVTSIPAGIPTDGSTIIEGVGI